MAKVAILMADGCEEIEALTVVDLLRRANITIDMVNIHNKDGVNGSHKIKFETDQKIADTDFGDYNGIVLPGGLVGTNNLKSSETVIKAVRDMNESGKLVSAICAAPTVLAHAGIVKGKKAICYPGMEDQLTGAIVTTEEVVKDGNIITSRGMGTAIPFALAIIAYFQSEADANDMAKKIVYQQ